MATWYDADATGQAGESVDVDGTGFAASIEGGQLLAVSERWRVEPQAQPVWNHLALDDQRDGLAEIGFDADDAVTGRLGLRAYPSGPVGKVEPYLKVNLWQDFSADDTVDFGSDAMIVTELDGTAREIGGGFVAPLNEAISLFATADYTTNLGGKSAETRVPGQPRARHPLLTPAPQPQAPTWPQEVQKSQPSRLDQRRVAAFRAGPPGHRRRRAPRRRRVAPEHRRARRSDSRRRRAPRASRSGGSGAARHRRASRAAPPASRCPAARAKKSPCASGRSFSPRSFLPIQAGSITRMSRLSDLVSPLNSSG